MSNVDITLVDGTKIAAGSKISEEQIKNVAVDQDITFTAIYSQANKEVAKDEPAKDKSSEIGVPNTGGVTGETNAIMGMMVMLPIGIVGFVLAKYAYDRKKHTVKFDR